MKLSPGQVYQMDAVSLLRQLPRGGAGAVICDPPYMIGMQGRGSGLGLGKDPWVKDVGDAESIEKWSDRVVSAVSHALRPGGAFVIMGSLHSSTGIVSVADRHGLMWKSHMSVLWNWGKPRIRSFGSLFDLVVWFSRKGAPSTWNYEKKTVYSNVLVCDKVKVADRLHITQKPIELTNFLITLLTNKDDLVVDPFCGSGSTLVSAELAGRPWIGGDLDEGYVDIATMRTTYAEDEEQGTLRLWKAGKEEEL